MSGARLVCTLTLLTLKPYLLADYYAYSAAWSILL